MVVDLMAPEEEGSSEATTVPSITQWVDDALTEHAEDVVRGCWAQHTV